MEQHDLSNAPHLFVKTVRQFMTLMQGEMELARAEISRNLSRAGVGIAFLAVAGLIVLVALNVLASALVAYITATGLSAGLAALMVGGGLIVVATVFGLAGKQRLSGDALAPTRTTENLKRDIAKLKETTHA
ncbi:MAG: phage holin family protein [Pseudomonadota bacterium]